PGDTLHEELRTTTRQLNRLLDRGAISQQQHDDLVRVIYAELSGLASPKLESAGSKMVPENREGGVIAVPPGPGLVPAAAEVVEAVLVEAPPVAPPAVVSLPVESVHPLDRPYVPPPPKPPSRPARPLADVLQSFMEESNIRWGEILAATLIVLCSVGLVISLRNTLKNIPYFPALLFTLFTVSFHGAGLYTLRRWNLQAVSRPS